MPTMGQVPAVSYRWNPKKMAWSGKKPKTAQANFAHMQKKWHKTCSSNKFKGLTLG